MEGANEEFHSPIKKGRITSKYGVRTHPVTGKPKSFHAGVDVGVETGTPIYAVEDGVVTNRTNRDNNKNGIVDDGYGHFINLEFDNGEGMARYAHLSSFHLKSGTSVKKGDIIGYTGNSGRSTGPHLHFQLHLYNAPDKRIASKGKEYVEADAVDPLKYIDFGI